MAWLELSIFTICVLNTFGEFFLDQYISTKESWMADYCKQDKEVDPTPSEDWMGSSVDPPCFGQSKIFLYTCVTKSPLTPIAMFQWEIKIEPSFSMENLQEVLTAFYSCFSLWKGLFFFLAQHAELFLSALIPPLWEEKDSPCAMPQFRSRGT